MSDAAEISAGVSPDHEAAQPVQAIAVQPHVQQIDSVLHSVKSRLHAIAGEMQASHLEHVRQLQQEYEAQRQAATEALQQQLADAESKIERMKEVISKERNQSSRLAGAWFCAKGQKVRAAGTSWPLPGPHDDFSCAARCTTAQRSVRELAQWCCIAETCAQEHCCGKEAPCTGAFVKAVPHARQPCMA